MWTDGRDEEVEDAWKKMEEERELLIKVMEQAGKERVRLKEEIKEVSYNK